MAQVEAGRHGGRGRGSGGVGLLALLAMSGCADGAGPSAPAPPALEASELEWVQLFDGVSLEGWIPKFVGHGLGENLHDTFRVEEGLLKVRYDGYPEFAGQFGHLFHQTPYSHYLIAVEYRFVGEQAAGAERLDWAEVANRNNGVLFHAQPPETMGREQDWPVGVELQLLGGLGDGAPRPTGNVCTPGTLVTIAGRTLAEHCADSGSPTYDGERWVRVEALVLGDSVIKHIVEGDTVLVYTDPRMGGEEGKGVPPGVMRPGEPLSAGFIALQAETAPTDFRRIELVDLAGCTDPRATNHRSYYVKSEPGECRY